MTKLDHAHVRVAVAACSLLVLGLFQPRAASASPRGCQAATIAGASQLDPATGAFVGGGSLGLGGDTIAIHWVSVITGETQAPDGTLTLQSSHHITSVDEDDVDFTTSDVVIAVPTDVPGRYVFSNHLTVASGSGRVRNGSLDVQGRVDLIAGTVVLDSSSGSLCAVAPAN